MPNNLRDLAHTPPSPSVSNTRNPTAESEGLSGTTPSDTTPSGTAAASLARNLLNPTNAGVIPNKFSPLNSGQVGSTSPEAPSPSEINKHIIHLSPESLDVAASSLLDLSPDALSFDDQTKVDLLLNQPVWKAHAKHVLKNLDKPASNNEIGQLTKILVQKITKQLDTGVHLNNNSDAEVDNFIPAPNPVIDVDELIDTRNKQIESTEVDVDEVIEKLESTAVDVDKLIEKLQSTAVDVDNVTPAPNLSENEHNVTPANKSTENDVHPNSIKSIKQHFKRQFEKLKGMETLDENIISSLASEIITKDGENNKNTKRSNNNNGTNFYNSVKVKLSVQISNNID